MAGSKPLVRQGGRTQQGNISIESVTGLSSELSAKVSDGDPRLSDSREWTAGTVTQAEAEAGTASTRRAWTAQRVRQAIAAWYLTVSTTFTRTLLGRSTAAEVRGDLGLGTAATKDVGESSGNVMEVGAFGVGLASVAGDAVSGFGVEDIGTASPRYNPVITHRDGLQIYGWNITQAGTSRNRIFFRRRLTSSSAWGGEIEILSTGNILSTTGQSTVYPMTQKAVTDAINARGFADASGILTATSGALSNDMSTFLSLKTKAEIIAWLAD